MKYMYNALSFLKLKHFYVMVFLSLSSLLVRAQSISLDVTPLNPCAAADLVLVNVVPSGFPTSDVKSYTIRWGIPNDTSVNEEKGAVPANPNFSKTYPKGGDYIITVVVKRKSGGPDIVTSVTKRVWNGPVTQFILQSDNNQCFKYNNYVFNNTSRQGDFPSASLTNFNWTMGDGNAYKFTDTTKRIVNHRYLNNSPTFKVGLTVIDSVGCRTNPFDPFGEMSVFIAPDVKPSFTMSGQAQCDSSIYIFQNTSVIQYAFVDSFIWDYGDSNFYFSGVPGKQTIDAARWADPTQHIYTKPGVFYPKLTVYDKRSRCVDTFDFSTTGLKLPENIIPLIEILSKRALANDSLADSVCLMSGNNATLTLYNNFSLEGLGGTTLQVVWRFNDPNANPPGSDVFLNVLQPTYQYKGLGQFFPTLTVRCPGLPVKVRTYNFYSRIDTLTEDSNYYRTGTDFRFRDFRAAPDPSVPQHTNPNAPQVIEPQLNGALYTRKGRLYGLPYFNSNGRIAVYRYDTVYNASDPTDPDSIVGNFVRWDDEMSSDWDFFDKSDLNFVPTFYDRQLIQFRNPQTGFLITRPVYTPYYKPITNQSFYKDTLLGFGVQIIGPMVRIEKTTPATVLIQQWQKLQCGPTFPVQFVNTSLIYQSERLWKRWDFGEDNFAPACTSYSFPNPGAALDGLPPYTDAADLQNRTLGAFVANGTAYLGRFNACNYSHDSLPTRLYNNWDAIFDWYKYGHDFPPYDSTTWTKGYTKWPTNEVPPTGFNWVQPRDTVSGPTWGAWNKPMVAVGPTLTRVDTMTNIWPADINPNNLIILNNPIPDPISNLRGNWMDIIPSGTRIDSGQLLITLSNASDGRIRSYRGSNVIPGTNPPMTLYRYAFNRRIIQDYTVTLQMKDSINNMSRDPGYRTVRSKPYIVKVYDPITKLTKDSTVTDSLFLDDWDCKGSSTVTLSFTRPDALGLSQDGFVCPGFRSGSFGGNPQLIFNRAGYLDSARTASGPGIVPNSTRNFLMINYDSLLDRNDQTPCALDGFVPPFDAGGATSFTTPGGTVMPIMYNRVNFNKNPGGPYTSASGTKAWTHYFPGNQPAPDGINNMPIDPKGWVTIGLIVGTGCASPTNCNGPGCLSDTVWYHKFFRFITLNADFTIEKYAWEDPAKPNFCYLRGKNDTVVVHYFDSIQDNMISDIWDWGDGTATIDSFYYQPDTDEPYNRIRYEFNTLTIPWSCYDTTYYPVGINVFNETVRDTIWRCDDPLRALPPQRIDVKVITRDTSFMLLPVSHKYTKTSFEMMVQGGTGLERRNDITPIIHIMVANNFSRCQSAFKREVVIGIIDTFDILDASGKLDTIFCQGETVYFRDSLRYWYTAGTGVCSRPIDYAANENLSRVDELFDRFHPALVNYPFDTTKNGLDLKNYTILPGQNQVCPIDRQGINGVHPATGAQVTYCVKFRTYFYERLYWDFESDGVIDAIGNGDPSILVSHKYPTPGRFKVSMITRDTVGYWDTCFRYVNVIFPNPKIGAKNIYFCGDDYLFQDSSDMLGAAGLDSIIGRKWWFGDFGFAPQAFRSILKNPIYDYRKYGRYTLKLEVTTEQGCVDSIRRNIFLSGPRPKIFLLDDTLGCVPHKVRIVSVPEREDWASPSDTPTKLTIIRTNVVGNNFHRIKYSTIDTVEFVYDQPGTYYIFAEAFDDVNGKGLCGIATMPDTADGFEPPIRIKTFVPYKVDFTVPRDTVCVGEVFKFTNKSDRDTINRFRLDIYDGDYGKKLDTLLKTDFFADTTWQYRFNDTGRYNFVLNSTRFEYGFGRCENRDTITMVAAKSKADFTYTQAGEVSFRLQNKSDSVISDKYTWKVYKPDGTMFDGFPKTFDETSPLYDFIAKFDVDVSTDLNVCIIADVAGTVSCPDSVCKIIKVILPDSKINIPNAFSPNGDGINDNFVIEIANWRKYNLTIWNRWGNTIFESDDPAKTWNGKTNNEGADNPPGTYYYIFTYQLKNQTEKTIRGSISLIK